MTSPESIMLERASASMQNGWLDDYRVLLGELRYNSLQHVLVGGIFALFFSQHSQTIEIWIWWASFAVVVGARSAILRYLENSQRVQESHLGPIIYSCIGVTAFVWGFAPLATGAAPSEMLFLLAVSWVLIVVIGGVSAFHADPFATAALALPATLPSLIALLSNNERASLVVVLGIALTYGHIIVCTIRARRARTIELALRDENAALLQKY